MATIQEMVGRNRFLILGLVLAVAVLALILMAPKPASADAVLESYTVTGADTDPLHDGYNDTAQISASVYNNDFLFGLSYEITFYLNDSLGTTVATTNHTNYGLLSHMTDSVQASLSTTNSSPIDNYRLTAYLEAVDEVGTPYFHEQSVNIQLYPMGRYRPQVDSSEVSPHVAEPGATTVFNFTVKNLGNCPDTLQLGVASQSSWQCVLNATSSVPLQPNGTMAVSLTVTVPSSVAIGVTDSETITATSSKDGSKTAQLSFQTRSSPFAASINMTCDNATKYVELGGSAVFGLTVTNHGSYPDAVSVSTPAVPSGWARELSAPNVTLNPGASSQGLTLTITAPSTDVSRTNITVTVTAASQDGSTTVTVDVTVVLLVADLQVRSSDIVFSNDTPAAGQVVTIYANIANVGTKAASSVLVQFSNGTSSLGTQTISTIAPQEVKSLSMTWTAVPGTFVINVTVDPSNSIIEFSEANNYATRTLAVAAPDLAVSSSDITTSKHNPKEGDTVNISVTVRNSGTADAGPFVVRFLVDGTVLGDRNVPSLAKGASAVVGMNWKAKGGSHTIEVQVNPDGALPETSVANDESSVKLSVAKPETGGVSMVLVGIVVLIIIVVVVALAVMMMRRRKPTTVVQYQPPAQAPPQMATQMNPLPFQGPPQPPVQSPAGPPQQTGQVPPAPPQ